MLSSTHSYSWLKMERKKFHEIYETLSENIRKKKIINFFGDHFSLE